jgi:HK97 family phage major capsid protein
MKIFAKQLEAARKKKADLIKVLENIVSKAEEEDRSLTEDESKAFDETKGKIQELDARIQQLESAQAVIGERAVPVTPREEDDTAPPASDPDQMPSKGNDSSAGRGPLIQRGKRKLVKGAFFARQAHLLYLAGGNPRVAADIAERDFGDKEMAMVLRAAQSGADSATSAWAGTLVQQEIQDFIDLLRPLSVFSRIPAGTTITFDSTNSIRIPKATTGTPGGFVAEGGAIPVKQGAFSSITLTPSKLGVITVATREVLARSTPALETLLRDMMLRDTAITLDRRFFSTLAATSAAPSGLLHTDNAPAAITASNTSNAADDAIADIKAMMSAMFAASVPMQNLVWLMHPSKKLDLMALRSATGAFYFRDELVNGTLQGIPVIDSSVLDKGLNDGGTSNIKTIALVDASMLVKGNGLAPTIALSTDATLHMDDAPNSDILVPTSGGKSLFQTDATALRLTWETTWRMRHTVAVQYINNVNW